MNIAGFLFCFFCAAYGAYVCIASVRNWKSFNDSYKRIDLIKIFGDFGRILYAVFGLAMCIFFFLMLLRVLGYGPFVNYRYK